MSKIEIKNIYKEYGKKENKVIALDNISLNIEEGEIVAILGKSGSGKSTLMHIIAGIDRPTSGEILIDGESLYKMNDRKLTKFRRNIGIIYQFFNLLPILNVEENVLLTAKISKKKIEKEKVKEILRILDMEEQSKKLPNQLSGGQQQRVAIGRALITDPSLILADEPTGNLDSANSKIIENLLVKANREMKKTIIIITHDEQLAQIANRIVELRDGKIVSIRENNNRKCEE